MKRDLRTLGAAALLGAAWMLPASAADEPQAAGIANKMTVVVEDLGKKQTGKPVQGEQKEIVRDLDELIASLEKQCAACRGGIARNRPTRGMPDSNIHAGNGEMGPQINPADGGKDWGKLSDRERDRILQSMSEGFPPEYRTVLERYYRRLADEKSAKAPSDPARAKEAAPAAPAKP
jgi:hypothetical protein